MFLEILLFFSISILFIYFNIFQFPPPILGIYRLRGRFYYIKFLFLYTSLYLRKWFSLIKKISSEQETKPYDELDRPQKLSNNKYAIDAVYFNASSQNKTALIIGTARRTNNLVNGFVYLRVPEFSSQLLLSPRLPSTCLRQTSDELGTYEVENIKLSPIIPMRSWKLEYDGNMRLEENSEKIHVKIDATFTSNLPYFNFDTDMSPISNAAAIAKEPWSREYFETLKLFHQTHYEQYGDINGHAVINQKKYPLCLNSVRDHSFGEMRDWKVFHRYAMHFVSLENGDRITVGLISIPITFSEIEVGFITKADEKKNYPITEIDFKLYQHGENGTPPKDYAFSFKAGHKKYVVQVKANASPEFYIGEEAECKIVEVLCSFDVNGVRGWGAAEWEYRNLNGLPIL